MKRLYIIFLLMIFVCIQLSNAMEIKGHVDSINGESIGIRFDGDFSGSVGDVAKVTFIQIDGSERVIGKWEIQSNQGRLSIAKPIEVFERPGIGQSVVVDGTGEKVRSSESQLDPDKPESVNPDHPKVASIIKQWISSAEPPMNATDGANARYEPFGRWVGEGINGVIGKVIANPDDVAGRTPEKYVWDKRNELDSVDHCTLGDYVIAKLNNSSIDHCKGRYKFNKDKQAEELLKKARELWEQGKLDEAIKTAKKASQTVPKNAKISKIHKGMKSQKKIIDERLKKVLDDIRKKRLKEAEATLARAAAISTTYPEYTKSKEQLKNAKTKAKEYKKRMKQAEGLLKKAREQWKKGALSEAIETAQKASRIVPKDTKTAKTVSAMQRQKKSMDTALSECEKLIARGVFKKAESTLKKAERISSNYPPYVKMLDKLRKAKEKLNRIKKIIKEAKQEWKRKKPQSAISKLDKVLTIDPRHKEAGSLKKEWEKILRDEEKARKPNWDNGCYNGKNTGGAMLQWTLRDPPPYSGLTPICSDRNGKLWILNNHISQIIKGKQNSYGCYSGSTVRAKNSDYRGTLCRPKGYNENSGNKLQGSDNPSQVNGTLWDVWGPIPYGYGKKCFTKSEVTEHMKPGAKKGKNGWYASKDGGTMKPTGKSCTKSGSSINPSGGKAVIPNVVGMSKKQAEGKLKAIGLKTKVSLGSPASSRSKSKRVEKTIPNAGTTINRTETVTIVLHPPFVDRRTVPSLTGATESEIIKKIKNASLIPEINKVKASSAAQSGQVSSVNPSSGTEVMAGTTVFVDVFDTFDNGSESDPWVDKVMSFTRPPGSSDEGDEADIAIGPPTTAKFVAIDKPETIVFAFTDNVVVDAEGNDLKLHEYINGDSRVEVLVSVDNRRYISLGKTAHSTEYDLGKYNLSTVRYVKLVGLQDGGRAKGYDLMAIEALNSRPNSTTIFVDTVDDFGGKRTVPSLGGLAEQEIINKIKDAGLVPEIKKVKSSSSKQSGKVSKINPLPGTEVIAGSIIYVDLFEDFGGGKNTEKKTKCDNYYKCLGDVMQQIEQISLKMASGQGLTFGCKYLGLGQAIAKVSKDANLAGCKVAGNYEHTGDMIKKTAGQMCKGQAVHFDINKLSACRKIGTNSGNVRNPTGGKVVLSDSVDDFNAGKYPLPGGVPHLNVPRKILGLPFSGTYFLSEWNVPKTFQGGFFARPLSGDIDSKFLKDMGAHMVSFYYENPGVGMALGFFWLEPNDPVIQDKMQQYMKPLCNKRNMHIREVENSKGKVVRKDLTVYSSNTWSGILTSMPRQLFGKEDALIKTMTDLLEQLEPYVKQCN